MNENKSLSSFGKNISSQRGEDGILEKIFEIIKAGNKWCVEFGAWDGKLNSNTYNLIKNKGWSGVLIEASKTRYSELVQTYKDSPRVICLNKFVTFDGENTIDNILQKTNIPQSFDLISIDIDGNDYHIWDSMHQFQPRIVVIEFNPTIPADTEFIQAKDMNVTQGSSLLSLYNLGKRKGYELVATTQLNGIFVKKEYFHLFNLKDNSPVELKDTEYETKIFQLYDGTIVTRGQNRLLWNGVEIRPKNIQIVPKMFRAFPDNMNKIQLFFFKIWRKIHNKL